MGERADGTMLSGGQRQLIGLVRTLLKQPDLLLLDEATASLDQQSENIVHQALDKYAGDITRISITHRLKGTALADRILVLNHEELVEEGTHEELLSLQGLYARLWREESVQSGEEAEEFAYEGGRRHERQLASNV